MVKYSAPWVANQFRSGFVVKYERDCKIWMTWKEDKVSKKSSWVQDKSGDIVKREMRNFLSRMIQRVETDGSLTKKEQAKVAERLSSTAFLSSAMTELSILKNVSTSFEDWDSKDYEMGTPSGIIDLRTGIHRDMTPEDLVSKRARSTPSNKEPTVFLGVLNTGFKGDQERIKHFQRVCGMLLSGETDRGFFIMYGGGGNGKSKIVNAIAHAMGDYAKAGRESLFTRSRSYDDGYYMFEYREVRLVSMAELTEGLRWDTAKIKSITGGDLITARKPAGQPITFKLKTKVLISCNSKPEFDTVDDGVRDRVSLIRFEGKPAKKDTNLPEKLAAESAEILTWMIEGHMMYLSEGLNPPKSVMDDVNNYFEEENPVTDFKLNFLIPAKGNVQRLQDVWFAWCMQCKIDNTPCGTAKMFAKNLKLEGIERVRRAEGMYILDYTLDEKAKRLANEWDVSVLRRM